MVMDCWRVIAPLAAKTCLACCYAKEEGDEKRLRCVYVLDKGRHSQTVEQHDYRRHVGA